MPLGDLPYYAGIMGIVLYLCLMLIKHAGRAARLQDAIKKHEEATATLQERLVELRAKRDDQAPVVDDLLAKVMELRGLRDQLQIQYEDLQERVQETQIDIKSASRGSE